MVKHFPRISLDRIGLILNMCYSISVCISLPVAETLGKAKSRFIGELEQNSVSILYHSVLLYQHLFSIITGSWMVHYLTGKYLGLVLSVATYCFSESEHVFSDVI